MPRAQYPVLGMYDKRMEGDGGPFFPVDAARSPELPNPSDPVDTKFQARFIGGLFGRKGRGERGAHSADFREDSWRAERGL